MPGLEILTVVAYYLPGYKFGGPIRTLANMVDRIGDEFQFKIVTTDRDFEDRKPYPGINIDSWNRVGNAKVFYMSPKMRSFRGFKKILCSGECDVIYLNSFFSPHFTIKPLLLRRVRLIPDKPLIIAPRGEFSPGALGLKSFKKHIYIVASKLLGLYHGVVWQASSEHEEMDIRRWLGHHVSVIVAPNLPLQVHVTDDVPPKQEKIEGCLKIVFLSRISRKKNLYDALEMLNGLKGKVQFNIYGPIEDMKYWSECQGIIGQLPSNIEVQYYGMVAYEQVASVMMKHDLFFLPTLGENFGHVILEGLCMGCPILISDQTPWQGLEEKGVGWDLPLQEPERFQAVLQKCVDMDQDEHAKWSKRAREYGLQVSQDDKVVEQNRQFFQHVLGVMSNNRPEKIDD